MPPEDLAARRTPSSTARACRARCCRCRTGPGRGTPPALADDTSAAIVDRYLRAGAAGPEVVAVTNNHYDEDGLFGIWLLLERPADGAPERALAIAAAEAGDFATWTDPWAARVAIAAMAMAERATTPFPEVGRALARAGGRDPAGALYLAILPRVGGLLADPERYRDGLGGGVGGGGGRPRAARGGRRDDRGPPGRRPGDRACARARCTTWPCTRASRACASSPPCPTAP